MSAVKKVLTGLGFVLVLVTLTPFTSWYARLLSGHEWESKGDVLIVLGGSDMGPGLIGDSTYWRAVYALRAYRSEGFRTIVLSGKHVAESMRDFLTFQGVPESAVLLESRSLSTRENALFTHDMLASTPGRKVLLTSDYHMLRAKRAFERAGVEVAARPIPHAIKFSGRFRGRWTAFVDEVIETGKILYYFARGWM